MGSVAEEEAGHDLDRFDVDRFGEIVRCTFAVGRLGTATAGRVRERNRYAKRSGEENMKWEQSLVAILCHGLETS